MKEEGNSLARVLRIVGLTILCIGLVGILGWILSAIDKYAILGIAMGCAGGLFLMFLGFLSVAEIIDLLDKISKKLEKER